MAQFFNPEITFLMDDGTVHTVQTINPDMLRWERDRKRLKYEDTDKFTFMTFLAWAASQREKVIPDINWSDFQNRCHGITSDEVTAVDPTRPEAAAG